MNNKKIFLLPLSLMLVTVLISRCSEAGKEDKKTTGNITPKELPVIVPGFHFPEDSNVIYSWMNNSAFPDKYDSASVYRHAWGIWAGLTANSGEKYAGDSLLTFETWLGISEVQDIIVSGNLEDGCAGKAKTNRSLLNRPHQLNHGMNNAVRTSFVKTKGDSIDKKTSFWVTVSYDPNAACYATKNKILSLKTLNGYLKKDAIGTIPPFPAKAITIKPTYIVGKVKDKLIQLPAWPGPPAETQAYGSNKWPDVVYADVTNKQPPNKKLVPAPKGSTDPNVIAAATCNVSDFIYYKLDSLMAKHMNEADSTEGLQNAAAGDLAILMCMHVATKEISNWTWQTFYWAPDPANPLSPSSLLAASLRPSQLQGAASHYAVSTAYCMTLPNQDITGGKNDAAVKPMIGYNPFLEAGFDPSVLFYKNKLLPPSQNYGIKTNCMTCHALATPQSVVNGNQVYSSDQYISMADSFFVNKVQLDFAWSIQGNLIIDTGKVVTRKK